MKITARIFYIQFLLIAIALWQSATAQTSLTLSGEITGVATANEGATFTLTAPTVSGGSEPYLYQWTQTAQDPTELSGRSELVLTSADTNALEVSIPPDFIAADATIGNISFTVEISDGTSRESRSKIVAIRKIPNGDATFDTTLTVDGSQLSIKVDNLSDADGVGELDYQWQKRNVNLRWEDIPSEMTTKYTVPLDDTNDTRYRIRVTHTDAQAYQNTITEGPAIYRSDLDADGDGLIEIYYLEDLDALRYNSSGGYRANDFSFTTFCRPTCNGYELETHLDFNDVLSYADSENMAEWAANGDRTNAGWVPIRSLSAIFEGNGFTISNLYINNITSIRGVGLFARGSSSINNIGLLNVDVRGPFAVGGLQGYNEGKITNSYVTGRVVSSGSQVGMLVGVNRLASKIINSYVSGSVAGTDTVGGLVGLNQAVIANSYAINDRVIGETEVGGLVGSNLGEITNTYVAGTVKGKDNLSSEVGGLVGRMSGGTVKYSYVINTITGTQRDIGGLAAFTYDADSIVASHWDSDVYANSGALLPSADTPTYNTSRTTAALQSPTDATGIYDEWSSDDWDFGDASSYPALRYGVGDVNDPACDSEPDTVLPPCGALLSAQQGYDKGLSGVFFLSAGKETTVTVAPPFSSLVFDYAVTIPNITAIQLRPYTINEAATIAITKQGDDSEQNYYADKERGDLSGPIPADNHTTLTIVVTDTIADKTVDTTYTLAIIVPPLQISDITVGSMPPKNVDGTINEGSTLSLRAEVIGGSGNYEYALQIAEDSPMAFQPNLPLEHKIPEDLVDIAATTQNYTLKVIVSDGTSMTRRTEVVTVKKVNNDDPVITISVNPSGLSVIVTKDDLDGAGDFSYDWQKKDRGEDWTTVSTADTYQVPSTASGSIRYRVNVGHMDGQGNDLKEPFISTSLRAKIDDDDDGLIDIYYLEDLDAVRYSSDGSGYQASADADPIGCGEDGNEMCRGYELATNLDFNDAQSYVDNENMAKWATNDDRSNPGWIAIADLSAKFEGNGRTISNLYMNNSGGGLFNDIGSPSSINNVGLLNVDIYALSPAAGFARSNNGEITNSYVTGKVEITWLSAGLVVAYNGETGKIINSYASGTVIGDSSVGGLVGSNAGNITNTYAAGTVTGQNQVGGLVGTISDAGIVEDSYTISTVTGSHGQIGGLVASVSSDTRITASYWDSDVYMSSGVSLPPADATSRTTAVLQSPTDATGIYDDWSSDDWDFGDDKSYPALRSGVGSDEANPACDSDPATVLPQCGALLSAQQGYDKGLSTVLFLSAGEETTVTVAPLFSSLVFDYAVIIPSPDTEIIERIERIQLRPYTINDGAMIAITKADDASDQNYYAGKARGDASDPIMLADNTTIMIVVTDKIDENTVNTTYTLVITRLLMPLEASAITVSPDENADGTIDEGSELSLAIEASGGSGTYSYRWTQTRQYPPESFTKSELTLTTTNTATLGVSIPPDLIAADATTGSILFMVTISDGFSSISRSEVVVIRKIPNGEATFDTTLTVDGSQLSIKVDNLSDADGVGELAYQWQKRDISSGWEDITGHKTANYTVPPSDTSDTRYRVEVTHTDAQGYSNTVTEGPFAYRSDIDTDDDGLIEIYYLEDLDAVRHNLEGSGYVASAGAKPIKMGCDEGGTEICNGYELATNLDFNDELSYADKENMAEWAANGDRSNPGWLVLGDLLAKFEGNGRTISNLYMYKTDFTSAALFDRNLSISSINNIGLLNVDLRSNGSASGLVTFNGGEITNSYVTGAVEGAWVTGLVVGENSNTGKIINSYASGTVIGNLTVGGLVGSNAGNITNTYAAATVQGNTGVGGLVGTMSSTGSIEDSYTISTVTGPQGEIGGLVASVSGGSSIVASYWDSDVYASADVSPPTDNRKQTTEALQSPTTATGIYRGWSDDDWDFSHERSYPTLRYGIGSDEANPACDSDPATELPQCGASLSGQQEYDSGLDTVFFLSAGEKITAEVAPPFSAPVFDYAVTIPDSNIQTIQLRPYAINAAAPIAIAKQGNDSVQNYFAGKASGEISESIPLDNHTTLTIVVTDTIAENTVNTTYTLAVTRLLPLEISPGVRVDSMPSPDNRGFFKEGSVLSIEVEASGGSGNYEYALQLPDTDLIPFQQELPLKLTIADDLLGADDTTQVYTFNVIVRDGTLMTSRTIDLTISKVDNGAVTFDAILTVDGSQLSIALENPSDPDGIGEFSYRWQKREDINSAWQDIANETTKHTVSSADPNNTRYRVQVMHTDAQGYDSTMSEGPFAYRADIDADDDGLIEVWYLEDLDAMRHSPDGSSYIASASAKPITTGCDEDGDRTCHGYELATNLDFNTTQSYSNSENKKEWATNADSSNEGWEPIIGFATTLEGNGFIISNLYINRSAGSLGLFSNTDSSSSINNVGLANVDVEAALPSIVGGLTAINNGNITNSYVTGTVVGIWTAGLLVGQNNTTAKIANSYVRGSVTGNDLNAGGLAGRNLGEIANTYSAGTVNGQGNVGGLVGELVGGGSVIEDSYTISAVAGQEDNIGGLVASFVNGASGTNIVASYWDSNVSGSSNVPDDDWDRTTAALQSLPDATGIYSEWSSNDWDFGDANSYPALRSGVGSDENNPACDSNLDTELPQCGILLSGQQGYDKGLSTVSFLSVAKETTATVVPSFSALVFDYAVTIPDPNIRTIQLRPYAINAAAPIAITKQGDVPAENYFAGKASGELSDTIPIGNHTTLTIVVTDTIANDTVNTTYTLAVTRLRPLQMTAIMVSSTPAADAGDIINEGSELSLVFDVTGGDDDYEYTVQIGDNPPTMFRQEPPLSIKVPDDLLGADDMTQQYTLKVIVRDGTMMMDEQTAVLTIRKVENGPPDIALNVSPSMLSIIVTEDDPDGAGVFSYDWQKRDREEDWATVSTATTYTLPSGASGSIRYRVNVEHRDGQGNESDLQEPFILTPFRADIDDDDDGLIDIYYLEDLDAVRHSFDGSSYKASASAEPVTTGCLLVMSQETCNGYELSVNLDFNEAQSYTNSDNMTTWAANADKDNAGWVPIPSLSAKFDGNDFTISNLYINSTDNLGLFAINSSSIENVGLLNVDIRGGGIVSGLAALNAGKIANSYVTGAVAANKTTVGMLVGANVADALIINSYGRGHVEGMTLRVGGLVGQNAGNIVNSYAINDTVDGQERVGGLVGENTGNIANSYAISDMVDGQYRVGGLVGLSGVDGTTSTIINTYAAGTVEGQRNVGGLVGELFETVVIENSYTISTVTGPQDQIGGLVASVSDDASIAASYWDRDVYTSAGVSLPPADATSRTTEALQSPTDATGVYSEWSSDDWDFGDESSYPALRSGVGPDEDNPACDSDADTKLPQCGVLLSGPQGRARGLDTVFFLSGDKEIKAEVVPPFSALVFNYEVTIPDPANEITEYIETIQLRPYAINDTATITITKAGDSPAQNYFVGKASGKPSDPIMLDDDTTITIGVTDNTVNTVYTLAIKRLLPPLEISDIMVDSVPPKNVDGTINEGSDLSIEPDVSGGSGNYEYALQLAEDQPMAFQSNSTLELKIPEVLVGSDATTQNYTFKVIVREGTLITSRTEVVTIKKAENGDPDITVSVSPSMLSISVTKDDPDGAGDFSYDWQKRDRGEADWTTVSTTATYHVPSGASGSIRYRVEVEHTDGQGYDLQEPFISDPLRADIDTDDDGLIEIYYLEDLNAARHSLNGRAYKASASADPITTGCDEDGDGSCIGYELSVNLDFNDAQSYTNSSNMTKWVANDAKPNASWPPIPRDNREEIQFDTKFEGNGRTISNLYVNDTLGPPVGLFGDIGPGSSINNVGLLDVYVSGLNNAGGLAGSNGAKDDKGGNIINSYVTGTVKAQRAGMLVGYNAPNGRIINSYGRGTVSASVSAGGLVGSNSGNIANGYASATVELTSGRGGTRGGGGLVGSLTGHIEDSYTISTVTGDIIGGLVGYGSAIALANRIEDSYWDSGVYASSGVPLPLVGTPSYNTSRTTAALQSPIANTGIYSGWSNDDWDFGDESSYPALRYVIGDENDPACDKDVGTELPQCGFLLSAQQGRRGLNGVFFFSADEEIITATFDQLFSALVLDYDVNVPPIGETIRLRPHAINNADATIRIAKAGDASNYFAGKASGDNSEPIPIGDHTTITIVVTDPAADNTVDTTYTLAITRELQPLEISAITVTSDPIANNDGTIDEGSKLTLMFDVSGGRDNYEYEVQIGERPLMSVQQDPPLTVTVPADLLKEDDIETQAYMLKVIVRDGDLTAERTAELTIKKIENGDPDIALDVSPSSLSISVTEDDPDGAGVFSYNWQKKDRGEDWTTISTENPYTLDDASGSIRYRVTVGHTDGQGYKVGLKEPFILTPLRADIDGDDDGLIEIYYLEDLDAVRYSLDGSSYKTSASADPAATGCDEDGDQICIGYELAANLDFNDDDSYVSTATNSVKDNWYTQGIWRPIGTIDNVAFDDIQENNINGFEGLFDGNGYTIANLSINLDNIKQPNSNAIEVIRVIGGLFGYTEAGSIVRNVGLLNIYIRHKPDTDNSLSPGFAPGVGGLVGMNNGEIINSYVSGEIDTRSRSYVGGLVGHNLSAVINSYSNVRLRGLRYVGGLVSQNCHWRSGLCRPIARVESEGRIVNSYANGTIRYQQSATEGGGLAAFNRHIITNSYTRSIPDLSDRPGTAYGGLISENIYRETQAGELIDVGSAPVTTSHWQNDDLTMTPDTRGGPLSYTGAGRSASELRAATAASSTATEIYYDWSLRDWDFGTTEQYPILRYTSADDGNGGCTELAPQSDLDAPQCNTFLPNQGIGLRDLILSPQADVIWDKEFNSEVRKYTVSVKPGVNNLDLQLQAYNPDTSITVGSGDAGDVPTMISLDNPTLEIVTSYRSIDTASATFATTKTTYTVTINTAELELSAVGVSPTNTDGTVNEGTEITLTPEVTGGSGNYRYEVQTDEPRLTPLIQDSSITIEVPNDFIVGKATTKTVTFTVTVQDDFSSVASLEKTVTIFKTNAGKPDIEAQRTDLTISVSVGEDLDGGVSTTSYVWQRRDIDDADWIDITGATMSSYDIPATSTSSILYRVQVSYSDAQGFGDRLILGPFRARSDLSIDDDNDQLIDIYYLEDLDLIREQYTDMPTTCGADSAATCIGFELRRSLDFQDATHYESGQINNEWTTGEGWQPIGNPAQPFNKSFEANNIFEADGTALAIANLLINRPNEDYVGLFGAIQGQGERQGWVFGIDMQDVDIIGKFNVGGIAGLTYPGSRIVFGSVSGNIEGQFTVGGMVGITSFGSLIANGSVDADIVASDAWIGGIVGLNYGSVINSSAKGSVTGGSNVGGLAGYSFGPITNSYAYSNAIGKDAVGGLVGYNHRRVEFGEGGFITGSYAGGSAEGVFDVGGLVGFNDGGTITDTYTIGNVVGSINVGGLVGSNYGTVDGSYGGGRVTGTEEGNVDDLVGNNDGTVTNERTTTWTLVHTEGSHNGQTSDSQGYTTCGDDGLPDCGTPLPEQDQPGDIGALVLSELVFQERFGYILEPPFDPTKTSYELVSLANNLTGTYLSNATTNNPAARITVRGAANLNPVPSIPSERPFVEGLTISLDNLQAADIEITVTAAGQTPKTYTIALSARPDLRGTPSCHIVDGNLNIDEDNDGLIDICDIEGLYAIRYQLDGTAAYNDSVQNDRTARGCFGGICRGYELVNNLDFTQESSYRHAANHTNSVWTTSDKGWYPIGEFANPFSAEFNGNGFTISGLTIDRNDSYDYVGLFGHIGADAEIKGVNLTNVNVAGRFNVGGLVGWNNQGEITDSHVSGTVAASEAWVGGLVGDSAGLIANSHTDGMVSGDRIVGGMVGYQRRSGTIINSYSESEVGGRHFVGGFVGLNNGLITNSYATGNVGDVDSIFTVGGLVGLNSHIIRNSYASGDVQGHTLVGGLAGDSRGEISDSYASGNVQGEDSVGILVGSNSGAIGDSYATESDDLNTESDDLVGLQYDAGSIERSSTISVVALQSPSFDPQWSSDDWFFGNGQYPTVRYTAGDDPQNPQCESSPSDMAVPDCEAPLMGQNPELNSLTAEAPAELSRSEDYYGYVLRITRDVAMVTLTLNVDDGITPTYRVDDGTETSVTSDTPFTVMLPADAQTITITLQSQSDTEQDGVYTINIDRTVSAYIKILLEGLLQ